MPFAVARSLEIADQTVSIYSNSVSASRAAGEVIARTIRSAVSVRGKAVLGLATGTSSILVYEHLASLFRQKDLSFADVTTYNLDEYYPTAPTAPQSYRRFMADHLFDKVDLAANRTHLLDGTVPEAFAADHAAAYDDWIKSDGGLDLQFLGVGRNGHIGFNEPSDIGVARALELPTRLAELHPITLADAARDFGGDETRVPRRALTMGIAPILSARSILVLAFGASKAAPVAQALTGPICSELPASLLQTVSEKVIWILDEAAARDLG